MGQAREVGVEEGRAGADVDGQVVAAGLDLRWIHAAQLLRQVLRQ